MPGPPNGRVGRKAGAAEHHEVKHRIGLALSHTTTRTRAAALACVVALAIAGTPAVAAAQTASPTLASIRAAVDVTAGQWFAAQSRAADLDRQIQMLTKTLADDQQRVAGVGAVASRRAVQIYEDSSQSFNTMFGNTPVEVGRRAVLVDQANAAGQHAIDELMASVNDLKARRGDLRTARSDLTGTLRDLAVRRQALDAELTALQLRSTHVAADRAVLAAQIGRAGAAALIEAPTRPATTTPVALVAQAPPSAPLSVAAPPDTGAVSPHHDAPFLVCTRARESNGNYTIDSGNGYYGAYQFSRTTWNASASHAGRLELVGVLPSSASEYDQDEIAWALYQWQGSAPWGGRC